MQTTSIGRPPRFGIDAVFVFGYYVYNLHVVESNSLALCMHDMQKRL